MPPAFSPAPTEAQRLARQNWAANLVAIAQTQPRLAQEMARREPRGTGWLFARDGFLTCRDAGGRWWSGCSLPKRAGDQMLRNLVAQGVVGCLLAPTHAGQVVSTLEKLGARQATIVVQPDLDAAAMLLACHDFSAELAGHRFWLACGPEWPAELERIFTDNPGLPTPTQFIRTPTSPQEVVDRAIAAAEPIFQRINGARAARAAELSRGWRGGSGFCAIAPSQFRLWDDAGAVLAEVLAADDPAGVLRLDVDDPASASALGLATAAAGAAAVVVPNRARSQLPDVLPPTMPLVTWLTMPHVPAYNPKHPNDALLLADAAWFELAAAGGWPASRLAVAGWPTGAALPEPPAPRWIALIADTVGLDTPTETLDSSSHHVLWEQIRAELHDDPLQLQPDADKYVSRRMAAQEISEEGFNRELFFERLIAPAYAQGVARALLRAGVPLKLYGAGWEKLDEFAPVACGPVRSRRELRDIAAGAAALVYTAPLRFAHPIDALSRPVLAASWREGLPAFVRAAQLAVRGNGPASPDRPGTAPLSLHVVRSLL